MKREIKLHKKLKHKNIVRLFDFFKMKNKVFLLMEYAEKGNLYHSLKASKKYSEAVAANYFTQVCHGVAYLHKKNVCHRDLKVNF